MFLDRSHTGFLKSHGAIQEKAGFSAIRTLCDPVDFDFSL